MLGGDLKENFRISKKYFMRRHPRFLPMSHTKLNFEKRQKSEARFGDVVTLQSQTTKVNAQRATTVNLFTNTG